MSVRSTIGERLKWLLKLEGRSIKALSDASGIPYGTLQQYLSDTRKPGADHLAKLARSGIDLHWLVLGESEPSLKLVFPEGRRMTGPVAADAELANLFLAEALSAIDDWHSQWVKEHGAPMATSVLFAGVFSVFALYDELLNGIADQLIKARQSGWDNKDIAEMVLTSPVRQQVRKRLRVVEEQPEPRAAHQI